MPIIKGGKRILYLIFAILISFLVVFIYGIILIYAVDEKIRKETEVLVIEEVSNILSNLESQMLSISKDKNISDFLSENEAWRWFFTKRLEMMLTNYIRHVYMVAPTESGKFRVVIDTEGKHIGKLIEKKGLKEVLITKRQKIIHEERKEAWITLAKPVIQGDKVTAILMADFSIEKFQKIKEMISGIRWIILTAILVISVFLIFLIYQYVYNIVLTRKVYVDDLTGFYNTTYINDVLRYSGIKDYALIIIDIDDFRFINETFGKEVGDKVIKAVAGQIKRLVKADTDILIRYGGEEFIVLVKLERSEDNTGLTVAKRIYNSIRSKPINIDKKYKVGISVSIGVVPNISQFRGIEEAIRIADRTLYEAKVRGKNRIEIYTEKSSAGSLKTINEVKEAINEGRILFYYQPIYDLKSMKVVMYEALVRMRDSKGGVLTPGRFLPLIKGTSLYIEISRLGINRNIDIILKNKELKISMNFSASDLLNNNLFNYLFNRIDKDISERFFIELLEDEEINDYGLLRKRIEKLKKKGIKFKIDDFGAGYANFVRLAHLNIDYVKIDGSIVRNITKDKRMFELLKAMVSFCKEVGIKTTAEFIDSEEILNRVKEAGVDHGQGFYLGKPAPPEELGWNV